MNKDIERILFSEQELSAAVSAVGKRLSSDYAGKCPLFVGILKGSFIFMSDLVRSANIDCGMDFMAAKSYGNEAVSSGKVNIVMDIGADISGRDVILVEDILDSGRTLFEVREALRQRGPASVKICALLDKKAPKAHDIQADYKCFDIENEFVVGYGLDYAEKYRFLPYIGVLKKEIYS